MKRSNKFPEYPYECTLQEYAEKRYTDGFIACSKNIYPEGLMPIVSVREYDWWIRAANQMSYSCTPGETVYLKWVTIEITHTRLISLGVDSQYLIIFRLKDGRVVKYITTCFPEVAAYKTGTPVRKNSALFFFAQNCLKKNQIKFHKIKFINHE